MDKLLILFGDLSNFPNLSEQLGVEFIDLSDDVREKFLNLLGPFKHNTSSSEFSLVACGCDTQNDCTSIVINEILDHPKHGIGIALFDAKGPCSMDEFQKLANERIAELIVRESRLDIGNFSLELIEKSLREIENLREIVLDNGVNVVPGMNRYYIPHNQRINLKNKYSHKNFRHCRKILRK